MKVGYMDEQGLGERGGGMYCGGWKGSNRKGSYDLNRKGGHLARGHIILTGRGVIHLYPLDLVP